MLAIKANRSDDAACGKMIKAFEQNFSIPDVRFELLTLDRADRSTRYDKIALPNGKQLKWSAW